MFRIKDISFQVHKGEILGIAGVSGNGQDALCDAISGYRRLTQGKILLNGQEISAEPVRERIQLGIGYVPSDRHRYGLILPMKLTENMFLKRSFRGRLGQTWLDRSTKA